MSKTNTKTELLKKKQTKYLLKNFYKNDDTVLARQFCEEFQDVFSEKFDIHLHFGQVRRRFAELRNDLELPFYPQLKKEFQKFVPDAPKITDALAKKDEDKNKLLSKLQKTQSGYSIEQISKFLKAPNEYSEYLVTELKRDRYDLTILDGKLLINPEGKTGATHKIDFAKFKNITHRFGLVSDNHLNSKFERLDVLNGLYDIFQNEGIQTVLNGGNWIEGEARFNKFDIVNHGLTKQVNYFVDNYPQRAGVVTKFIAGDDHEGWYRQTSGMNIGEYTEMKAKAKNRNDLIYLGYVESDIILETKKGQAKLRLMHGGGGTAYAMSYTPQKMIESFQGGEKPHILALGHYHKADYMYYRDVHCLQLGCTQDQTTFMRKKKIQAHIGGWIVEFQQSEDGAINRFKAEWIPFFDRGYYERHEYYQD